MTGFVPHYRDRNNVLPFRQWMREHLPIGAAGCVVEDLDLIVRAYGPNFDLDATGRLMLLEMKHRKGLTCHLAEAQDRTFHLLDDLIGDHPRYCGFWVVAYDDPEWSDSGRLLLHRLGTTEKIGIPVSQFAAWISDTIRTPSWDMALHRG